ncbi:MAG: hypothetical protein U0797_10860 [Gemmataceae bacterium]
MPTTSGVRSPGGVGLNAAGDVFYTDNQGPWNGTCHLKHITPGGFVGHPAGFKWYKEPDAKYLGGGRRSRGAAAASWPRRRRSPGIAAGGQLPLRQDGPVGQRPRL